MRSKITFVAVLSALSMVPCWASAQAPAAGGAPVYGYYVPVVTNPQGYGAAPANYSLRVSDGALPEVSPSCDAGCGCSGCASQMSRGCGIGCGCLECRQDRFFTRSFGSIEYLHWWNKGISVPPLVTTSPAGTPQGSAGVLPGAETLFGGHDIDSSLQAGGRLTFGWWLDDCCNLALTSRLYGVESGTVGYTASSAGNPILARPFFNADPLVNAQDSLLVAFPGVTSGAVTVAGDNDVLGFELLGRSLLDSTDCYRLDLIGGYQFNRIDSDLAISSVHNTGAGNFVFSDLFDVDNQYHAGTAGFALETYRDCWTFSALGKVAIGNMRQTVDVSGFNSVTAGGTVTTPGGLLTQPTNIGTYERDVVVWAPEVNLKMSCALTQRVSVSVGYSFLYFTRVAFAGDQIDPVVNATQLNGGALVGTGRPGFNFVDTDFWIQTVDLGLSYNY